MRNRGRCIYSWQILFGQFDLTVSIDWTGRFNWQLFSLIKTLIRGPCASQQEASILRPCAPAQYQALVSRGLAFGSGDLRKLLHTHTDITSGSHSTTKRLSSFKMFSRMRTLTLFSVFITVGYTSADLLCNGYSELCNRSYGVHTASYLVNN